MRLDVFALVLGGLSFVGFGALMLLSPQSVMASIGLLLPDGVPTTEIRSFYGGLELGLGALLLAAIVVPAHRPYALLLGAVSYGAIGLTRGLAMWVDGSSSQFLWIALVTEIGLAAIFAWARLRSPGPRLLA